MTPVYRFAAAALLLTVAACSQTPNPEAAALAPQAFGTPQNDEVLDLVGYSGGVYAVGNTRGSLHAANKGDADVFITKIGSDKRTVWSRQFGTSGADGASHVATDAGGNVYVFGNTTGNLARTNRGGTDFFLRRYSASGGVVWTLQFGLDANDAPLDLVTTSNSVYVLGSDGGELFLYRFNLNGSIWWKRQIRTLFGPGSASLDASGNVYVASTFEGTWDHTFEAYDIDFRLEKFSNAGAPLWTNTYNYSDEDIVYQMIAHGSKVYLLANSYYFSDDDSAYALHTFSGTGELERRQYLEPNDSNDLQLSNDLRLFVGGSGIYTDTLTDYYRTNDPDRPNERTLKRYRLDGTFVWEKNFLAFGTLTAVAGRGASDAYVGGYTGGAPRDALLHKLSAATGATVWSK